LSAAKLSLRCSSPHYSLPSAGSIESLNNGCFRSSLCLLALTIRVPRAQRCSRGGCVVLGLSVMLASEGQACEHHVVMRCPSAVNFRKFQREKRWRLLERLLGRRTGGSQSTDHAKIQATAMLRKNSALEQLFTIAWQPPPPAGAAPAAATEHTQPQNSRAGHRSPPSRTLRPPKAESTCTQWVNQCKKEIHHNKGAIPTQLMILGEHNGCAGPKPDGAADRASRRLLLPVPGKLLRSGITDFLRQNRNMTRGG
jgi:hypothetical protein